MRLVAEEGGSFKAAAEAVKVSEQSLRAWHAKFAPAAPPCGDNAVAERFFWSLKYEWTKHETFENLEAARLSVFKYIETFYNFARLHQSLGGTQHPARFWQRYSKAC